MDFDERLKKAVERGANAAEAKRTSEAAQAMSEEQLRRLHSQYRLKLSEYIERCLQKLAGYFPEFRYESVVSDRGWGAAVTVEEWDRSLRNALTRLEVVVAPFNSAHVLELVARGTVHNKEVYNRNFYQPLEHFQIERFQELVDLWVPEFAEIYAGHRS